MQAVVEGHVGEKQVQKPGVDAGAIGLDDLEERQPRLVEQPRALLLELPVGELLHARELPQEPVVDAHVGDERPGVRVGRIRLRVERDLLAHELLRRRREAGVRAGVFFLKIAGDVDSGVHQFLPSAVPFAPADDSSS